MLSYTMKAIIAGLVIAILTVIGVFVYLNGRAEVVEMVPEAQLPVFVEAEPEIAWPAYTAIGTSKEGRSVDAYTYGEGDNHLLFVGGMHGGYEWNSVLLADQFKVYLDENIDVLPEGLTITVVPNINPDGVYAVTGKEGHFVAADVSGDTAVGRFNGNGIDLNRNFDCKWKPESTWRGKTVSAGTAPFSEPEAAALQEFVAKENPVAVVFWHSQGNAVYASECENGILPETLTVMNTYAAAAGYEAIESFDAYPITGDAEGWLASMGIPAITVELSTHEVIEWEKNIAGIKALFALYGSE